VDQDDEAESPVFPHLNIADRMCRWSWDASISGTLRTTVPSRRESFPQSAEVGLVVHERNVIEALGLLSYSVGVYAVGDIPATAADEDSDPHRLPPDGRGA